MSTTDNDHSKIDDITSLLAPEIVESSKILECFSDAMEAPIKDLMNCNEIKKIFSSKEDLVTVMKKCSFVALTNENTLRLVISKEETVFSLINIPLSWENHDILTKIASLSALKDKIVRLYKSSVFWYVVFASKEAAETFEKDIQNNCYFDDKKIKYNIVNTEETHKRVLKQISQCQYNKETSDLKNKNQQGGEAVSKLSWRKKSNDSDQQQQKSSYKNSGSGTFQRSSGVAVRDRYNSDGGQQNKFFRSRMSNKKTEEIEIDLSKINYSLKIKHKYSNADILLFYDKYRIKKLFDAFPKFEVFVEDVCAKEKRKEFNFLKRERSLTYSMPMYYKRDNKFDEIKLNLDAPAFQVPNQNPLAGKLSGIQINK